MPTLKLARVLAALIVVVASACSSASSREDFVIFDNSRHGALAQIGTVGTKGYGSHANYKLIMRPSIVGNKLLIPKNDSQAVEELKNALPKWYLSNLKEVTDKDQNGEAVIVCKSENQEADYLVRQWLVVYWNLDDESSALARLYASRGGYYADSIAEEVMSNLCRDLST